MQQSVRRLPSSFSRPYRMSVVIQSRCDVSQQDIIIRRFILGKICSFCFTGKFHFLSHLIPYCLLRSLACHRDETFPIFRRFRRDGRTDGVELKKTLSWNWRLLLYLPLSLLRSLWPCPAIILPSRRIKLYLSGRKKKSIRGGWISHAGKSFLVKTIAPARPIHSVETRRVA